MKKGFTIIELLVVVAIIAVLSSIVIVSIDVYRTRSSNTNIQATLGQVRSESLLYQQSNGSFLDVCEAGEPYRIAAMLSEIQAQSFIAPKCFDDSDSWVATTPLRGGETDEFAWCVDSNNFGGLISSTRYASIINANTLCQ
jgi:prepilin-type N-terminal cleavage/methylation domain-containing protein